MCAFMAFMSSSIMSQGDDFIDAFEKMARLSKPSIRQWLASHRPLFAVTFQDEGEGGQLLSFQCQLTDAMAKTNLSLPNIAAVVSGHFHAFEVLEFQKRPAQLVVGNSGTQLATPRDGSPNGIFRAVGRPLLGESISYSEAVGEFGWAILETQSDHVSMSAFFLGDEEFKPHPEIQRTFTPSALQVDQLWANEPVS